MSIDVKKNQSPFIANAFALDQGLTQLEFLAHELTGFSVDSDKGMERAHKLLAKFDECRRQIAQSMQDLGANLEDIRTRIEKATGSVVEQATAVDQRQAQAAQMLERFKILGEMVRKVTSAVGQITAPSSEDVANEQKAFLIEKLPEFNTQMGLLVEEARKLVEDARNANMRSLEKSADSLRQSLQSASTRLQNLAQTGSLGDDPTPELMH